MPDESQKLTDKQRAFCEEYLIDFNATQAAIRAGYKPDSAKVIGCENLTKPYIHDHIQQLINDRSTRVTITADSVVNRLNEVANRCMQAEPVYDRDGKETGEYQFNAAGANKALELLGKHLGLFIDRKEFSGPGGKQIPVQSDTIFEFIPVGNKD